MKHRSDGIGNAAGPESDSSGKSNLESKCSKEIKLLTCSAGDYVKSKEKSLSQYDLEEIRVDYEEHTKGEPDCWNLNFENYFRHKAEEKSCEVVVDVREIGYSFKKDYHSEEYHVMRGTGLILKKKK